VTMGAFAGIGMLLVVIGIFSVMAYTVSLRTHEIGVRMALGAQRSDVLRMVLGRGSILIGVGIAIGLLASFGLTRYLANQVWGISVTDPWTYCIVVVGVIAVGVAACLSPARRASKVEPMTALRYE
jgi:putative ABC transport system permease protein